MGKMALEYIVVPVSILLVVGTCLPCLVVVAIKRRILERRR